MNSPIRLGLVGLGKIARDEHLPAIAATPSVTLEAIATHSGSGMAVPLFRELSDLLSQGPDIDAVIMCQPPQVRFEAARQAILAGKHVFLEKPPGATVAEVAALDRLAREHGVTLFASWHSRFASQVAFAREWISQRPVERVAVTWREDVRKWHPGQEWIWRAGGFGVFDPGINALSIVTEILPEPLRVKEARLEVPANREAPIAASVVMQTLGGAPVVAEFDWRETGGERWDIVVHAGGERLNLGNGGHSLGIGNETASQGIKGEYPAMYRHFAALVARGASDVDVAPLQLVADSFLVGTHIQVAPFDA